MTGSGTAADPYIISNVDDLQAMANDLTAYYELGGDIDASATSGWNAGAGFAPVGVYSGASFTGQLDGKGYTIDGLFINRPSTSEVALFGGTKTVGQIKNVNLTSMDITGKNYVGALVGGCDSDTIENCYSTGSITGDDWVGGLIGAWIGTSITFCNSSCTATGISSVGGFTGSANGGTISRCYATGAVVGVSGVDTKVGGFVGWVDSGGTVEECYATGSVSGTAAGSSTAAMVGGFVGKNEGTVTNCYARGNATGTNASYPDQTEVGGFVGHKDGTINYCYSTGTTTCGAGGYQGGFCGFDVGAEISTILARSVGRTNVEESWATIVAGAGITVGSYGSYAVRITANSTINIWATLYRIGLIFDLSGLTGKTLVSATLILNYSSKSDDLSITPNLNVYPFTPASEFGIIAADYNKFGTTEYATSLAYGDHPNFRGDTRFTFNLDGEAYLAGLFGGTACVGIRNAEYDVGGSVPTWSGSNTSLINLSASNPKLHLRYTPKGNGFWDNETSGDSESDDATGKTTTLMKTQSTFTDAGWNFTTIWSIRSDVNDGYPNLRMSYATFPVDTIVRATNLIHRYNRKEGTYTLEIALGEVTSDFGLPEWLSRPRASIPDTDKRRDIEEFAQSPQIYKTVQEAVDAELRKRGYYVRPVGAIDLSGLEAIPEQDSSLGKFGPVQPTQPVVGPSAKVAPSQSSVTKATPPRRITYREWVEAGRPKPYQEWLKEKYG